MENEDIFYDKLKEMIFEVYESSEENYNEKLNSLKTFFGFHFGDKNTMKNTHVPQSPKLQIGIPTRGKTTSTATLAHDSRSGSSTSRRARSHHR